MNPDSKEKKQPGFASLADAKKALKAIVPPVSEGQRLGFLAKLRESPHPRQLAFRLLAILAASKSGRLQRLLSLFEAELVTLLSGGSQSMPAVGEMPQREVVAAWVKSQFAAVAVPAEAALRLEAEQHLWPLYQILRCWADTPRFVAALTIYTDELQLLATTASRAKQPRQGKRPAGFSSVVSSLVKRVPTRPAALAPLLEVLRLCRVWAAASEELQQDLADTREYSLKLKAELETERAGSAAEKAAREDTEARERGALARLAEAKATIDSLQETLRIQAGAHGADSKGAVADAIADLRRKFLPELENIRLYADRAEPNTAAILRKAQELTKFLTDFRKP